MLDPAVAIAEAVGDAELLFAVVAYAESDDVRDALARTDKLIALADGDPGFATQFTSYSQLLRLLTIIRPQALVALGRLDDADATLNQAARILAVYSDALSERFIRMSRSMLALARGDIPEAVRVAIRAVELASEVNSDFNRFNTLRSLLAAHVAGEDWDRAELTLSEAAAIGFKRPNPWIAALHFARGRVAEALVAADECIAKGDVALERAQAHLQRARIRLRTDGAAARADVDADHAAVLALIESRGVEGIRPELHESRAELARVLGDEAGALQELREAHRLYVAINATGHAARLGQIIRIESRGAG